MQLVQGTLKSYFVSVAKKTKNLASCNSDMMILVLQPTGRASETTALIGVFGNSSVQSNLKVPEVSLWLNELVLLLLQHTEIIQGG